MRELSRDESRPSHEDELGRGVQGIQRWKGLDEQGQFRAIVETTGGIAYYRPVSARLAQEARVGQAFDLKRSIDKDEQIELGVRAAGGVFDGDGLAEGARHAYRQRLQFLAPGRAAARSGSSQSSAIGASRDD